MTLAIARPRPLFTFALLAAAAVSAELAVVASQEFSRRPGALSLAVAADLCLVLPAAFFALTRSWRGSARVAIAGAALAGALLGLPLRWLTAPLELSLLGFAVLAARRALLARRAHDPAEALRTAVLSVAGDNALGRAVAAELSVLWFALLSWRSPAAAGFSSHRKAGWSAVAFALALATLGEGLAAHFLLRKWGALPALVGGALHVYGLLWLVGDARALALRRTTIDAGALHVRLGLRWQARIPLASIARVELRPASRGELPLRVLGATNVALELTAPVEVAGPLGVTRLARSIALQLDEPEALQRALANTQAAA